MPGYKLIVKNAKVFLKTVTNAVLNISGIKDLLTGDGSVDSNNKINWTLQEYTNTSANFTSINPVLLLGQKGIETDDLLTAPKFKIGDGVTAWNSLPYFSSGSGVQSVTGPQVDNTDPLNPVIIPQTILTSPDGLSGIESADSIAALLASDGTNFSRIDVYPTEIQITESSISTNTPLMVNYSKSIKSLTDAVWGNFINSLSIKATPVNADSIHISDSAASNTAKKLTLTNFKAFLKTYFDGIYTTTSAVATQITTALSGYLPLTGGALTGLLKEAKSTDIASATTTDLSTATGNLVHITGTTTITSFGTVQAGTTIKVIFDGVLTLTNNATSLILPSAANIITAAGDSALLVSEGSGNWKCMFYQSAASTIGTWSPSWTGFSANPVTNYAYYSLVGDVCTVWLSATNGTSNATACTVTLPFAAKDAYWFITSVVNNSSPTTGLILTSASSNIATGYATSATGAWTAGSTGKTIRLTSFSYRIA